jgi:TonB family protein
MISIKLEKTKQNHGYEPQSKLWKYFAANCGFLYPPLRGIVQLTNSVALRFRNWSFNNKLFAVSASIVIHIAVGSLLILGLFNDLHLTTGLNKLNSVWVSLETITGNDIISPDGKRADRKQSRAESEVANRTIAIPTDKISAITTISATNNIPVQSYTGKEDRGGKALSATGTESSHNFSDATASPEAGYSSAFVTASPLYRENIPPVYPAMARLRGYEGVVLVNAEILPDGRVGNTAISKSSGYTILDQSAMEAVKLWKFEPAKKAGKPFAIRVKLPIKFVLHDDNSQS